MTGPHAHPRKPLSPMKANGPGPSPDGSKGGLGSLYGCDDVFAESVTKPERQLRASRIPRATPSPDPRHPSPAGATPSLSSGQPSRIPRPGGTYQAAAVEAAAPLPPRPGSAALLSGYHRYSNPSFDEAPEEHPTPAIAQPVHPPGMATPEAVQLLQKVGAAAGGVDGIIPDAAGQQAGRVGDIVDSYLRTGPQKLSPEPQKDYCIAAPKPEAVAAAGRRASAASASGSAASASAARNCLPGTVSQPQPAAEAPQSSPEAPAIAALSQVPPTPASVCSNIPDDVFADLMENGDGKMLDDSEEDDLEAIFGPAPVLPPAGPEVRLAAPVDSAGHMGEPTAAGMGLPSAGKAMAQAAAQASPSLVAGIAPHSTMARRPSRVTFALPSSPTDPEPSVGAASTASFSFGMGAGATAAGRATAAADPGSPTPEPMMGIHSARKNCPSSADSVDQPNPFSSMLYHLKEGGPGVCVSPHPRGGHIAAGVEYEAPTMLAQPPQVASKAQQIANDSPRSPSNQTPLRLLPEGVPPSATPELGKGDLSTWIARRGMSGLLSSPAAADLRRMWEAVRSGGAAAAEADVLRAELAAAREELARLESDHAEALGAAQAGQQWAEAEVRRAQQAAEHMMALADQIQATFATCEEEKVALAEELEEAWQRADTAEAAQRGAEEAAEAREVALRSAEELKAIKRTLAKTWFAMDAAPSGEQSTDDEGCATPFSKLKEQLQHAHEALTALHASGCKQSGAVSPVLDRLVAASAAGLGRAQALLRDDSIGDLSDVDNGELRELLSGVQARIMALSPARPAAAVTTAADAEERSPSPRLTTGTVTVDFRQLRSVLAGTTGQPVPPSPLPPAGAAGPESCELEVDGVLVTNIPPAEVSRVRSMVEFFEDLAGGGAALKPEAVPPASPQEASFADVWGAASPSEAATATAGPAGPSAWTPVPPTAERLRAFLPPRAGVTPAGYAPTPVETAAAPRVGPPAAPAATPVDDATPQPQRRHMQALDALEALQMEQQAAIEEEEEDLDDFDGYEDDFADEEASFVDDSAELSAHSVGPVSPPGADAESLWPTAASPAPPALSPSPSLELALVGEAPGTGLRTEVRARLNRLKEELRAAQSKLNHVDAGLAAITTPGSAPQALPAPPLPAATPAAAGPTPRTARLTTRPSVRFADSVKLGSEEAPRRLPRTPGLSSSRSVYASALAPSPEPEPIVASNKKAMAIIHQDQQHSPDSSFAIMAVGSGLRSPAATAAAAELAAAFAVAGPTPLRRLNLDSDSSDEEDAGPMPRTQGSARSRLAMMGGGRLAGPTPAASSRTPMNRPDLYTAGYGSSTTPLLTRFSSASSSVGSPAVAPADPAAALLGLRPAVVGRSRRGGPAGGKRVSDSEEREFRRRAAALKIHVSPYFKRGGGRGSRAGEIDSAVTVE